MPRHFWRITIVTGVLPSRDSEIRGAIVRIAKTNTILKCPVNKLFKVENTYNDTNQIDEPGDQKFTARSILIGKHEHWEGEESLNIRKNNFLIRFNKTQEICFSVTRVLSILLTTAATSESVERANSKEHLA